MVAVVVPFALGILFSERVVVPVWLLVVAIAVAAAAILFARGAWRSVALCAALCLVGALLHGVRAERSVPYDRPLRAELCFDDESVEGDGYTRSSARIVRAEDATLEGWRVVVWGDVGEHFSVGDRLEATIRITRFGGESYGSLMYHRGYVGTTQLYERGELRPAPPTMHRWAVERISAAQPDDAARDVVLAMTTGSKAGLDASLRKAYAAGGASHLLAVSGLHVGILFLLVNLLMFPLTIVRHGNLLRSLAVLLGVWGFVALCGFAPSAVRAAVMFSLLQLALHSTYDYSSGNILAATAFVMLLCDTHLLFDISFALSFTAVAAIIFWGVPLCRLLHCRYTLLNLLSSSLAIGLVATVATMPMVSAMFGVVSFVGVLLNPLVVVCSYVVVLCGLLSLLLPGVGVVAHAAAEWQNALVEGAAALEGGHLEMRLSSGALAALYLLFVALTLVAWAIRREKRAKFIG